MTPSPDLSIVVPVYNEEENLPLLWPEIREVLDPSGLAYEVIFVDDGSQDRSAEIVREFRERDARMRLIRLKANAGETAATDAGFKPKGMLNFRKELIERGFLEERVPGTGDRRWVGLALREAVEQQVVNADLEETLATV